MSKYINDIMKKIQTTKMFSSSGWNAVHAILAALPSDPSDDDLANGFIEFQETWYYDNGVIFDNLEPEMTAKIESILLDRWTDCLLKD